MSYRALGPDEEKLEEQIHQKWDAFLMHMQDAYEFVNTQTPLITQNLDESYQVNDLTLTVPVTAIDALRHFETG